MNLSIKPLSISTAAVLCCFLWSHVCGGEEI